MPRDQRLYMTFPIDFWTHPKVSRLSDAAFRAFVESNGHSRMRETDGVIEADDAEFNWTPEALAELVRSHPSRPLMTRNDAGDYVLRDYAEHQFTKADRELLIEKRVKAGRASADKRRALAEHVLNETEHVSTRKEKGIGTGEEKEQLTPGSAAEAPKTARGTRGARIPEPFLLTSAMKEWAEREVPGTDITVATRQFVDYWRAESGSKASKSDWVAAWRFWLRRDARSSGRTGGQPVSKADKNAAEFQRLYGGSNAGTRSLPALDSRVST